METNTCQKCSKAYKTHYPYSSFFCQDCRFPPTCDGAYCGNPPVRGDRYCEGHREAVTEGI